MDQLARVLVAIEDDYVDPVDRARLVEGGIKGMVAELDPHSSYLPPEDYTIFQGDTRGPLRRRRRRGRLREATS